jgi:hypothetical protein
MGIKCATSQKMQRTQVRTSRNMSEPSDTTKTYQTYIVTQCLYLFVLTVLYHGFVNVCKCPNWTSPKYWGYNLQQIMVQVMFKIPKIGTFTKPCLSWLSMDPWPHGEAIRHGSGLPNRLSSQPAAKASHGHLLPRVSSGGTIKLLPFADDFC